MSMRLHLLVWMLLMSASRAVADNAVTIQAEGCFENMGPRGGVYPVVVTLHNSGPSADGALVVKSASFSDALRTYLYPVSLPAGTEKQIVVYPAVTPYSDKIDFSFDGPAQAKDVGLALLDREGSQVGMIGDEVGALATLRLAQTRVITPASPSDPRRVIRFSREVSFNDCYAKPEAAPDRAAGYQSVDVLVLAGGAERLRPEQWAAIRHWVLDGGSLVMVGGVGATYLRVPDAASLLPVSDVRDASLAALTLPRTVIGRPLPPGTVGLASGTPGIGSTILASQDGRVVLARRALGAGVVLFVGFDPLEQPFRGWVGQHDLWLGLIRQAAATMPTRDLRRWTAQQTAFTDQEPYGVRYPRGPAFTAGRRGGTVSGRVDPFHIALPPLATIAWLFLAYFVLVIPVTYLVLKRLGRLEWAWVTSPVISVAFAYVFYLFTAQLYQAAQSRRTAGVVVAAAGDPSGQFDGFSEMFFPRGGRYNVGIPGAEALELSPFSTNDPGGYGYVSGPGGGAALQPLQTVDTGDVSAPDFQIGNLAFRRLYHTESVPLGGAVTASLTVGPYGRLRGTVRNGTAQALTECGVLVPATGHCTAVGNLAAGETKTIDSVGEDAVGAEEVNRSPLAEVPRSGLRGAGGAFLIARTGGEHFGPALGRDVGGSQSVALLVSLPVTPVGGRP